MGYYFFVTTGEKLPLPLPVISVICLQFPIELVSTSSHFVFIFYVKVVCFHEANSLNSFSVEKDNKHILNNIYKFLINGVIYITSKYRFVGTLGNTQCLPHYHNNLS